MCGARRDLVALAGDLSEDDALCEACEETEPMKPDVRSQFDGSEGFNDKTLAELGLPPLHIVKGADPDGNEVLVEFTGDLEKFFG